jgi:hypothetical protein
LFNVEIPEAAWPNEQAVKAQRQNAATKFRNIRYLLLKAFNCLEQIVWQEQTGHGFSEKVFTRSPTVEGGKKLPGNRVSGVFPTVQFNDFFLVCFFGTGSAF